MPAITIRDCLIQDHSLVPDEFCFQTQGRHLFFLKDFFLKPHIENYCNTHLNILLRG